MCSISLVFDVRLLSNDVERTIDDLDMNVANVQCDETKT